MQKTNGLVLKKQESQPMEAPLLKSKFSERQKRRRSFLKLSQDLKDNNGTFVEQLKFISSKGVFQDHNGISNSIFGIQRTPISDSNLNKEMEALDLIDENFEQAQKKQQKKQYTSKSKEHDTDCSFQSKKDSADYIQGRIQRKEFMYQKLEEIDQKKNFLFGSYLLTGSLRSIHRQKSLPGNEDVSHDLFYRNYNLHSDNFFETGSISSEEFERLPRTVHHGKSRGCQICMDELVENQEQTMLFCSHSFHSECIEVWLRSHVTCPLCKMDVRKELSTGFKLLHVQSAK